MPILQPGQELVSFLHFSQSHENCAWQKSKRSKKVSDFMSERILDLMTDNLLLVKSRTETLSLVTKVFSRDARHLKVHNIE